MNRTLLLINIVALLLGTAYGMHGPVLPVFAKNVIGASYAELGFIGLANFLPYMFIPLFVGILLDRFNNGHLLSIGVAVNTASVYLLSIAQSVPEIMVYRIMTGVAHAFFWPPCESIISNVSSASERVKNISKFTGFFVAGFMIGPLAGTVLLENVEVTFRILFQLASYVLAAAIVSSILVSRKRTTTSKSKFTFFSIKEMARFPEIIIMLIFCTASFGMILTIFPAFLNDKSISGTEIELLFFIFGISRLATLAMAGKLSRRTSETLIVATLTIALGLVISYVSDSILEFAVALVLMGFGFSIFFPFTLDIILSKTRKDISGSVIGAYETTFGIGWAIGPITAGFVSEFFGNSAPYLLFFVLGIGVTILSVARKKILEPKKN